MADYGKFSLSAPFERLLAEFVIEDRGEYDDFDPAIVHNGCGAVVCVVEIDDAFDVLVRTVINHDCDV